MKISGVYPIALALLASLGLLACTTTSTSSSPPDYSAAALALLKADFKSKNEATLERMLNQDNAQKMCSQYPNPQDLPADLAQQIESEQAKTIQLPADGKYLGDYKVGEQIAQNGRGMQSSDPLNGPKTQNGGNCYACHQMSKTEISYGNIGPSLYQYGKLRGQSEEIVKYTWGKIYNAQAFKACSNIPRFGHNGILQTQQIKDLMALLLDPKSPVNQ